MAAVCKYTSHKIRKIRWHPSSKENLRSSELFITGSWDNRNENALCVWSYVENIDDERNSSSTNDDMEPKLLSDIKHIGDVTEIKFLNADTFVTSSSVGSVSLYKLQRNHILNQYQKWERIHYFCKGNVSHVVRHCCPCTTLTARNEDIVTAGEDGRICHLNVKHRVPITVIDDAESCSINAMTYLKQFEIATANTRGQLKVWDLRNKNKEPVQKFCLPGDYVALQCLSQHPGQHQVIATGGHDGTLYIWDMRQEKYPVTLLSAHSASMLEVKFHPQHPNHLFTCSQDGSLWHWDCSGINQTPSAPLLIPNKVLEFDDLSETNPWLACDATKHRLEICSLLPNNHFPVNSLDIEDRTLLCGADNEAFYVIPNIVVSS